MKKRSLNLLLLVSLLLAFVMALGIPPYLEGKKLRQNKDLVLQQSLWVLRRGIEFYTVDLKNPPNSLQDLVDRKYLREIPVDPFTQSNQTWVLENSESGITDVHSNASGADSSGKPYNQY